MLFDKALQLKHLSHNLIGDSKPVRGPTAPTTGFHPFSSDCSLASARQYNAATTSAICVHTFDFETTKKILSCNKRHIWVLNDSLAQHNGKTYK